MALTTRGELDQSSSRPSLHSTRPALGTQRTLRQLVADSSNLISSPTVLAVRDLEKNAVAKEAAAVILSMDSSALSALKRRGGDEEDRTKSKEEEVPASSRYSPYSPFNPEPNLDVLSTPHTAANAGCSQEISDLYPSDKDHSHIKL
eukprot:CAMPEP_0182440254 /NCGR_PEP_ID=MMETSP1167-20130531/86941_1 /TAXON_ID=2988 /ORGANISM="Mallomonas Sp, Strain CCMP3275" /LENGTH=146 /DNA_ID=CAMNT_0024634149 /DNA_START=3002 /DNA_END=3442 /DNA_ORIENTATION=-